MHTNSFVNPTTNLNFPTRKKSQLKQDIMLDNRSELAFLNTDITNIV
jgi:hypothetical protein